MIQPSRIEVSIVMPAYNEEANIESTVRESMQVLERERISGEVIVTDDGSKDGTLGILERLGECYSNFRYVHLEQNVGYGGALKRAIDISRGEYVVTIDSDGQFDIGDLPRLLCKVREGHDCVTGYRTRKKDTLPRVLANRGYNFLVSLLCGLSFRDAQCALKIYRGEILRSLTLEARGFPFPTEALVKLHYCGGSIAEVPVTHRFRKGGKSKVSFFQTVRIMFIFLLYVRFKLALHKSRVIYTV
jgi:glycosyltransferase involved in cell wall biosynthesis